MPSDASAPPTTAAPINLSALPREMLPLASPLVSSSKERSLACGDIGSPSPKGGTRGSPAVSINAFSVKGWKGWRNFGEKKSFQKFASCGIATPGSTSLNGRFVGA